MKKFLATSFVLCLFSGSTPLVADHTHEECNNHFLEEQRDACLSCIEEDLCEEKVTCCPPSCTACMQGTCCPETPCPESGCTRCCH